MAAVKDELCGLRVHEKGLEVLRMRVYATIGDYAADVSSFLLAVTGAIVLPVSAALLFCTVARMRTSGHDIDG